MNNLRDFVIKNGVLTAYRGTDVVVEIPTGVAEIGVCAFARHYKMKEVRIPEGVRRIGQEAFNWCRQLTRVVLPESLEVIGEGAFRGCGSLAEVTLPAGLTVIGESAFGSCRSLTDLTIPEGVQVIGRYAFRSCRLRKLTIPASVKEIGDEAFVFNFALSEVAILGAVSDMGKDVFGDCVNLRTVVAPYVPWEILKQANILAAATMGYLQNRERYTQQEILCCYHKYMATQKRSLLPRLFAEDLAQGIEAYAEAGKLNGRNVQKDFLQPAIDAGATECIAFLMDWKSTNITPADAEKQWLRELNRDPYCAADMKKLWTCQKQEDGTFAITGYKGTETELYIPPRIGRIPVTAIGMNAFFPERSGRLQVYRRVLEKVTGITIPEGVTVIGDGAFRNCVSLERVTLPEGVTRICDNAFRSCVKLQEIRISPGVETIGAKAFAGCSRLQKLSIPEGTLTIGDSAFHSCEMLTDLTLPESVTAIGKNAMRKCPGLTVRVREGSFAMTCMKRRKIPFRKH